MKVTRKGDVFRIATDDDFYKLLSLVTDASWLGGRQIFATRVGGDESNSKPMLTSIMQSIIATDTHEGHVDIKEQGVELLRRYIGGYVECVLASDKVDHSSDGVIEFMRLAEKFMELTKNNYSLDPA